MDPAVKDVFTLKYLQERERIRGKLASTGRAVVDLSFAETASFAGNCFELTDGAKRFLAISKRAKVGGFSVHENTKSLPVYRDVLKYFSQVL